MDVTAIRSDIFRRRPSRVVPWTAAAGVLAALALFGAASLLPRHLEIPLDIVFAAALGLSALVTACVGFGEALGRRATHNDVLPHGTVPEMHARPAGGELDATLVLREILESLSDGFTLWDANDRMILRNQRMVFDPSLTPAAPESGIRFDDYIGMTFPFVDPRMTGGSLEAWMEKRRNWHRDADGSHEVLLKNGRWVLVTERRTTSGGTIGIYTDITRRKKFEEMRQQSERRLAHAQRLARVGIWEWDADTHEIYFSDIFGEILGLAPDAPPLTLEQFMLTVHPANRDIVRTTFGRLMSTGGQYNQEYQIIRPDGEVRTLRTESEAIPDESGRPARVIGAVHDLTDLKRAERALRKAMEAAAEGNRAKSEFLANVSHELRTPLNAIIGFSEVMQQEVFGPLGNDRYREYASDIRASGSHLLGIINDLLDYAKLEAGRLELHVEPVELSTLFENSLRLVRKRAEEADVTLACDVSGAPERIEADGRKTMQILLNLLSNAIKFTPAGGTVSLTARTTADGVEISVADTGVGMSAHDIEIALIPFGQVDSSLNRQQTGTGLGLPLSRALAELHGGRLDIESAPGRGTTVRVVLPATARRPGEHRTPPQLRLVSG